LLSEDDEEYNSAVRGKVVRDAPGHPVDVEAQFVEPVAERLGPRLPDHCPHAFEPVYLDEQGCVVRIGERVDPFFDLRFEFDFHHRRYLKRYRARAGFRRVAPFALREGSL
jgi:hypothetical protein